MAVLNTASGGAELLGAEPLGITGYPITMLSWIRQPSSTSSTAYVGGISKSVASNNVMFWVNSFNRHGCFHTYDGTQRSAGSGSGEPTLGTDVWVPMVATFEADERTVYKGTIGSSFSNTTSFAGYDTVAEAMDKFNIGSIGGSSRFQGLVSHFAVWNEKLTAQEIENLLNGANPLTIGVLSLRGYWAEDIFDDGGTWKYRDESINGYDLTLETGAVVDTTTSPPAVDAAANLGFTITDIKKPNVADELVTDVTNARVLVWTGTTTDDTLKADEVKENQTISAGEITVEELTSASLGEEVLVNADWDAGSGETQFFKATATIVDLDSSA